MPRKAEIDRPVQLCVMLPTSIKARLDALLYSNLEGRVPLGGYKNFFIAAIRSHLDHAHLDLAPYIGSPPDVCVVSGTPEAIEQLKRRLEA